MSFYGMTPKTPRSRRQNREDAAARVARAARNAREESAHTAVSSERDGDSGEVEKFREAAGAVGVRTRTEPAGTAPFPGEQRGQRRAEDPQSASVAEEVKKLRAAAERVGVRLSER